MGGFHHVDYHIIILVPHVCPTYLLFLISILFFPILFSRAVNVAAIVGSSDDVTVNAMKPT